MPGTATASTARGQRTRERLLGATAELVAERGFHAVGIADIGAAAGVTGSAIYRHFPSKQDILVALLDRVVDDLRAGAGAVVDDAATAAESAGPSAPTRRRGWKCCGPARPGSLRRWRGRRSTGRSAS